MGKQLAGLFGGAPKAQGPSEETLKAQRDQAEKLQIQEDKAAKKLSATKAVIAARSGRGQGITLNPVTGERGVLPSQLGGA